MKRIIANGINYFFRKTSDYTRTDKKINADIYRKLNEVPLLDFFNF